MPVRFQNLPELLNDMNRLGWIIDSFPFEYNGKQTIVILTLYTLNERKPSEYAQVKLEFISQDDANHSIKAYADFYEVHFNSVREFFDFFDINRLDGNRFREIFINFSECFARVIPMQKVINKPLLERELIGRRAEGNNPNAIYCFDVRRNGRRSDGTPNSRSIENSNKAEMLRPELYHRYRHDPNLSFFFSDNPNEERTDEEIINLVAIR
ncbi:MULTISPECIES: DUF6037 family protein [Haemophilus]|jgi:hypothetical protein|uniref:Uncharacterized protein n=2 Tax=Haemophilus parainfluenzae TaxID=729 RepID=A0AB36IL73_HAEPA|nr:MULTISPECIES: DUF6037 family protein [Haemophilus]EIJ28654.1 hypothetical protein HMPREF1119_1068 [Haemophilus parainfluenzae HK2019]MBS5616189.1 hypothetical protein [Haemophilus parainfluenzae]MBS7064413.1 hypothetical protein [Haemophilus parainfluenzae]MDU3249984.1 DUF6037 family protein [Haemophilus parainfluenzae]MDU3503634.1 DUF6037 family protein [Haemophilus parainfluenzae]